MKFIKEDNWLGEQIQKKAYQLVCLDIKEIDSLKKELLSLKRPYFIFAKVGTVDVELGKQLSSLGMYWVDTALTFNKKSVFEQKAVDDESVIGFSRESERNEIVNIGGSAFRYSRFHADPGFEDTISDLVKREWVDNFYKGKRGTHMVIAKYQEKHAGFLQLIKQEDILIIDLIGVSAEYRRKKLADRMIRFAEIELAPKELVVGTQASNIPSVRLYENFGFRLMKSQNIFHGHF